MTGANHAVVLRLMRHLADARSRERLVRDAALRASRRLGCDCKPLSWSYQAMKVTHLHCFKKTPQSPGERASGFRALGLQYLAVLSQSRIFAHLEIFELSLAPNEMTYPCQLESLSDFDRTHPSDTSTLVLGELDPWERRRHAAGLFMRSAGRRVDIARLTLLGPTAPQPSAGNLWELQGFREFPTTPGCWLKAPVYEANSARLDKG
jgi:hypothetical protein